jgi:hypothetical protein
MLLDALNRGEKPDALVFADVGDPQRLDPAEWPETYKHLREVVIPFATKHGIPFYWLSTAPGLRVPGAKVQIYPIRPGSLMERSLTGYERWGARTGGIQVLTAKSRACTAAAKVERYQRWIEDNMPGTDVVTWIGYDADEGHRIERKKQKGEDPYSAKITERMAARGIGHRTRYPLRDAGLTRTACKALIKAAGVPVPRKSACTACPFTTDRELLELLRRDPDTFAWIEGWERDRRAVPTSFNVVMGMYGFKTYSLSGARYRVLRKIQKRQPLLSRETTQQLPWLIEHEWVSADGQRLTDYGQAIVRAWREGPRDSWAKVKQGKAPYWTGKLLRPRKDLVKAQGTTDEPPGKGKSPTWPVRQGAGKNMQLGVHYESPTLREYLRAKYPHEFACLMADEETALAGELTGVTIVHPSSLLRKVRGRRMGRAAA